MSNIENCILLIGQTRYFQSVYL